VRIESPSGQTGNNRFNRISNVNTSYNSGAAPALLRITNASAVDGSVNHNTFTGNRRPITYADQITIGLYVKDTYLYLTAGASTLGLIKLYDQGTRTYVNGVRTAVYRNSATWPDNTPGTGETDVGEITRDITTGRVIWQDQYNDSVLIGPRPGVDVVSPYGAQRITSLATPAAPKITLSNTGSTTWTYYVVAIDKDGNKTPPSAAKTVTNGPATLGTGNYNLVTWFPVEGAVKYDLLRGDTTHSVATNLVATHFHDGISGAITPSAYTPSAVSPPGTLTVDGALTAGTLKLPAGNAPASATAAGVQGQIAWASGFVYVCVATNTWQRAALATW
jgi:hypothetical protein